MRLHALMPMGGLGSRFTQEGYTTPKPMIPVGGAPMFQKALASLDGLASAQTLVVRQETEDQTGVCASIYAVAPKANVVILPEVTRGAAETCWAARQHLDPNDIVVVLDCDMAFAAPAYLNALRLMLDDVSPVEGLLLTFPSQSPRYSYARSENGQVVEVAEKKVISNQAIAGAYVFREARTFLRLTEALLAEPPDREYYISHLYGRLLAEGGPVAAIAADKIWSFGTPEELRAYEALL